MNDMTSEEIRRQWDVSVRKRGEEFDKLLADKVVSAADIGGLYKSNDALIIGMRGENDLPNRKNIKFLSPTSRRKLLDLRHS